MHDWSHLHHSDTTKSTPARGFALPVVDVFRKWEHLKSQGKESDAQYEFITTILTR